MKAKRNYRDSLFRRLFNNKENLLSAYNAIKGTDYTDFDNIEINTLDGVFFNDLKNDISFKYNNQYIVLIEHQSTVNNNMPLRCLFYICRLYENIVDNTLVYREKLVKLPTPEFYVFYNGLKGEPEEQELYLEDAFVKPDGMLNLRVKVYNINYTGAQKLFNKCRALKDYSFFIHQVVQNTAEGMELSLAIKQAIIYCKNNNIMKNFLSLNESEVYDMISVEWDWNEAKKIWLEEGEEKGFMEGMAKGKSEGIIEGLAKGIARGKSEGIIEGLAKGIAKGKSQGRAELYKELLDSGLLTIQQLKETGKLSDEEIKALQ